MAYRVRPDGLIDLQLPNGMWTQTAVPEQQLQAMGVRPLEIQNQVPGLPQQPMLADASSQMSVPEQQPPQMSMPVEGMGGAPTADLVPTGAGAPGYTEPGAPKPTRPFLGALAGALAQPTPPMSTSPVPLPRRVSEAGENVRRTVEEKVSREPEPEPKEKPEAVNIEPQQGYLYSPRRRYVNVPERELLAARTVQKGVQIPPEAVAGLKDQWLTQDAAMMGAAAQARERLEPAFVEREQRLMQEQDDLKAEQASRRDVDRRLKEQEREIGNRVQELEKVKNPTEKRYWAENGGIGARLLAAISITAGGITQGLRGGQNPGLAIINNSIERWIDSEEREYNRKKGAVDAAKNDYAAALNRYGTPEAAREWLRVKGHTLANNMLENRLKLADVRGMEDQAYLAIQEQKNQRNQFLVNLYTMLQDKETQSFRTIPAHSVQVGGPVSEKPEDRKRRIKLADGSWGYVRSLKTGEADEVQTTVDAYGQLRAISNRMKDIISSVRVPGTVERRQLDALFNTAAKLNEQYYKMGVLREGDYQRAKDTFGDPTAFFKINPKASINEMVNIYDQGYNTVISNRVSRDPEGWMPVSNSQTNPELDIRSDE
jgi:hypothetical protein